VKKLEKISPKMTREPATNPINVNNFIRSPGHFKSGDQSQRKGNQKNYRRDNPSFLGKKIIYFFW